MEYWELVICGNDDIHGINLREEIRSLGNRLKLKGQVRNFKKDGTVHVYCAAENEAKAEEFLQEILKIQIL